jgi:hypothetical protein
MKDQLNQSRLEIAAEISDDTSYFYGEHEKRFTGIEIGLVIAGAFLVGFLKGFAKKLGEKTGEKLGESLGDYISHQIDEGRQKDPASQYQLLERAMSGLAGQIGTSSLDEKLVHAAAIEVEQELVKVLSRQAPDDVSIRIASKVRVTAQRVLRF